MWFDDIEKIRGYLTAVFGNIWIEMIVLVFVTSVMLTLNIKLAILSVLLVSFQFIVAHILSKRFKKSTRNMMNYRSVLSGFVFEKIQGAFLAKLFSSEKQDKEELDTAWSFGCWLDLWYSRDFESINNVRKCHCYSRNF